MRKTALSSTRQEPLTDEERFSCIKQASSMLLHRCGFVGKWHLLCPDMKRTMPHAFHIASAGNIDDVREFDDSKPLGGYASEELKRVLWYCDVLEEVWDLSANPVARSVFQSFINGNYTPDEAISLMEEKGLTDIIATALAGVPVEDIFA